MATPGQKVVAASTITDTENTSGTTTSTTFTATLSGVGATACGFAFVVPQSGKITVSNNLQLQTSADFGYCSFVIRTGATVGSGTEVYPASDDTSVITDGLFRGGVEQVVDLIALGQAAGSTVNIQQVFKASATRTTTVSRKHLIVRQEP